MTNLLETIVHWFSRKWTEFVTFDLGNTTQGPLTGMELQTKVFLWHLLTQNEDLHSTIFYTWLWTHNHLQKRILRQFRYNYTNNTKRLYNMNR